MKRLDGFLSRKAQTLYPDALVYCEDLGNGEVWTLERRDRDPLGLGRSFGNASQAVQAMIRASQTEKGQHS